MRKAILSLAACISIIAAFGIYSQTNAQTSDPNLVLAESLRDQLHKERKQAHKKVVKAYYAGFAKAMRKIIHDSPDAEISAALAGIAYGVSADAMIYCASSEGYAESLDRYSRYDKTTNKEGSGASGSAQFMPSTYAGTPPGRAGISIWRVDAQFHAMAWMYSQGRQGEWSGNRC